MRGWVIVAVSMRVLRKSNKKELSGLRIQLLTITILLQNPTQATKLLNHQDVWFLLPKSPVGGNVPFQAVGDCLVVQIARISDCLGPHVLWQVLCKEHGLCHLNHHAVESLGYAILCRGMQGHQLEMDAIALAPFMDRSTCKLIVGMQILQCFPLLSQNVSVVSLKCRDDRLICLVH